MLRIRLSRVGKKKQPSYRIVVADSRAPRDGAHIKIIGHYNPLTNPATLVVKEEDAIHWLQKGAKPSDTAAKLMTRLGIMEKAGLEPFIYKGPDVPPGKRPKKGEEAAPAPAATATAEAPAEVEAATEEPAAEAPAEVEATAEEPAAQAPAEAEATAEEPAEAEATADASAEAEAAAEEPAADAPAEEPAADPEPEAEKPPEAEEPKEEPAPEPEAEEAKEEPPPEPEASEDESKEA